MNLRRKVAIVLGSAAASGVVAGSGALWPRLDHWQEEADISAPKASALEHSAPDVKPSVEDLNSPELGGDKAVDTQADNPGPEIAPPQVTTTTIADSPTSTSLPANSVARGPLPVDVSGHGLATWYAAAERTTASRDYPRGTRLRVCSSSACVDVTVADYGPALWTGRSLDLSEDAFEAIAPLSQGVVSVSWVVL